MSETPKKKRPSRGRPEKQPSCNNFWRVYSVNSKHITESTIKIVFLRRISSKNQREKAWRNVLSTCLRNSAFPARKVCLSQTECVPTVQMNVQFASFCKSQKVNKNSFRNGKGSRGPYERLH